METSILEKIITGHASENEKAEFEKWLKESDGNVAYYEQMKVIWENSKIIPNTIQFNLETAKIKISDRILKKNNTLAKAKNRFIKLSVAASIMVILGISSIIGHQMGVVFQNTIKYTAQNTVKEVLLPDGSKVWINNNSTLIVPEKFKKHSRQIKLKGEAYFEVEPDKSRPFTIQTGKTVTKVLGTSFNIKMDTVLKDVSVTVNTGKVSFFEKYHGDQGVILLPGHLAKFTAKTKSITKKNNKNLNYLAWKTGILTFKNTPLKEVCKVLSLQYKKNINTSLSNPDFVITGKFENENLEDILSTIQFTLDVETKYENDQIVIRK